MVLLSDLNGVKRFRRVDILVFWFYFGRYTFSSYHLHFTLHIHTISFRAGLDREEYPYLYERGKKESTTSDHSVTNAATNSATSSYISYQPKPPSTYRSTMPRSAPPFNSLSRDCEREKTKEKQELISAAGLGEQCDRPNVGKPE